MSEIAFKVGSTVKWISGITSHTTCKDIIVSLVRTENLAKTIDDEDSWHRLYVLVEQWREVSKVLPSSSLILKIWSAWGDEQSNVSFTVKRVKHPSESLAPDGKPYKKPDSPEKTPLPNFDLTSNKAGGQKRIRRRNSRSGKTTSPPSDTLHPRALVRNKQRMCTDIQHQMKKIINQGEQIRKHLETLQATVNKDGECEQTDLSRDKKNNQDCSGDKTDSIVEDDGDAFNDSGNVTEGSETSNVIVTARSVNVMKVENDNDSECDLRNSSQTVTNVLVHSIQNDSFEVSQEMEPSVGNESSEVISRTDEQGGDIHEDSVQNLTPVDSDLADLINMLENLHRINKVLETKEEQILTMKCEFDSLNIPAKNYTEDNEVNFVTPTSCFNSEVSKYREINSSLLREISNNNCVLNQIEIENNERKKLVTQLEFDVNVFERESKRLQSDLKTIESIDCSVTVTEKVSMQAKEINNQTRELQVSPAVLFPMPANPSNMRLSLPSGGPGRSCDGPEVSSRDKTVRFSDQEDVCSLGSVGFDSPLPRHNVRITPPVVSPRSILKTDVGGHQKTEYVSDSGSDTGVSSLSSIEGDYELSTLV